MREGGDCRVGVHGILIGDTEQVVVGRVVFGIHAYGLLEIGNGLRVVPFPQGNEAQPAIGHGERVCSRRLEVLVGDRSRLFQGRGDLHGLIAVLLGGRQRFLGVWRGGIVDASHGLTENSHGADVVRIEFNSIGASGIALFWLTCLNVNDGKRGEDGLAIGTVL